MPLFVISFVFGQTLELSIFAEICRFRLNLPFSYNRHLSSFPSLPPHLSFCQTFDGFLPNPPFSQFANFVKSPNVNIAGLHLTSRRPCRWSRKKVFVSSGNQTLFSCSLFEKKYIVLIPNIAALSRGCKTRMPLFCGLI